MQQLTEIQNKKIFIFVAHPDDETLWFFQSIKTLNQLNEITIFCATQTNNSARAKELLHASKKMDVQVIFGNCEDTSINGLLKPEELSRSLENIVSKYKFDILITHPPHGGEKPHPHHIQLFLMAKKYSRRFPVRFGFFSERIILTQRNQKEYYFSLSDKKFLIQKIFQSYRLLTQEKRKIFYLRKAVLNAFFNTHHYTGFEVAVNMKEKHLALNEFKSQKDVLQNYKSYYNEHEYLFLEDEAAKHPISFLEHFFHQTFWT
jgi:LmbE family N-acetylglucosaminyl deacetylase